MAHATITPDQVRHVAKLSRLAVEDARLPKLAAELESILTYVDQIGELDVTRVEPLAHAVEMHNVFRSDTVTAALPLEQVLQNAAQTDGPFFKVPKVLSDEDSAG